MRDGARGASRTHMLSGRLRREGSSHTCVHPGSGFCKEGRSHVRGYLGTVVLRAPRAQGPASTQRRDQICYQICYRICYRASGKTAEKTVLPPSPGEERQLRGEGQDSRSPAEGLCVCGPQGSPGRLWDISLGEGQSPRAITHPSRLTLRKKRGQSWP